jgi:UDP-N-acetylglucosamine 4,6-dehydratase
MTDFFAKKRILVTGGTGSIGREIIAQLLKEDVGVVRVLSNDENSLFNMRMKFDDERLRFLLGDVRDDKRMKTSTREIDMVFHTAALKHVPIGEYNPFELVQTNVVGTQNLISATLEENVERFLLISSDKAVNPTSTMGASKLLCEKLVVDASAYVGNRRTRLASIRFGNVLDSRGSVLETFRSQIQRDKAVRVTDREMTRFAFSASQAVSCVLRAMMMMRGGEIFVPKMQALRVMDLATAMVEGLSPKLGMDAKQVKVLATKARPGEKIHEELMTKTESERAFELDDIYVIPPDTRNITGYEECPNAKIRDYSSGSVPHMPKNQIARLLRSVGAFSTDDYYD